MLEKFRMHADHQDLFIIRTVENPDIAPPWQDSGIPPQVIMIEFFCAGNLETRDLNTLGVNAGHHVLDRAVFTRCIQGLQDDQQGVGILGVQLCPVALPATGSLCKGFFGFIFFQKIARITGIVIPEQVDLSARLNTEFIRVFLFHFSYCTVILIFLISLNAS